MGVRLQGVAYLCFQASGAACRRTRRESRPKGFRLSILQGPNAKKWRTTNHIGGKRAHWQSAPKRLC